MALELSMLADALGSLPPTPPTQTKRAHMNRFLLATLCSMALTLPAFAQNRATLNSLSDKDPMVKRISCPAGHVQFARGVRWAPANNGVSISINDSDEVLLPASCYAEMYCARYKGASSVVIVDAPACGGNAVAEEFIVIDLISKRKVTLNYAQMKANVR